MEGGYGPGYYLADESGGFRLGDQRPYAVIDVGYANPLWSWTNRTQNWADGAEVERPLGMLDADGCAVVSVVENPDCEGARGPAAKPGWIAQLSLPVAFHLLWDPFTHNAPIVNTDYEFGAEVALRRAITQQQEVLGSLYLGHISTHVGDEYTIHAVGQATPFPRVNVSYEPMRVAAAWRRFGEPAGDSWGGFPRSRFELVGNIESSCWPLMCGTEPYYDVQPSESDGYTVPMTREGIEGSIGIVHSWLETGCALGSPVLTSLVGCKPITFRQAHKTRIPAERFAGILLGWQNVFPYDPENGPATAPTIRSKPKPVLNVVVGRSFQRPVSNALRAAWYLRYYRGPNPYGQLRNEAEFNLVSGGLTFSR